MTETIYDKLERRVRKVFADAASKVGQEAAVLQAQRAGKGHSSNDALAHGAVVEREGRAALREAFAAYCRASQGGGYQEDLQAILRAGIVVYADAIAPIGQSAGVPAGHRKLIAEQAGMAVDKLREEAEQHFDGLTADKPPHWSTRRPGLWLAITSVVSIVTSAITAWIVSG